MKPFRGVTGSVRGHAVTAVALVLMVTVATVSGVAPAAADKISDKKAEAARLAAAIEAGNERLSELAEMFNEARLRSEEINAHLGEARAGLNKTEAQAEAAQNLLRNAAVKAYMRGGALPVLPLMATGDGSDMAVRSQYVGAIANRQRDELDGLRQARADLLEHRSKLEDDQVTANAATAALNDARRQSQGVTAELRANQARVQGELSVLVKEEEARRRVEAQRKAERDLAARRAREQAARKSGGSGRPAPAPNPAAGAAVEEARRQLGKPYSYGASGPNSFDCSGLTAWAWKAAGRSLPHSSRAQFSATTRIDLDDVKPGDLLFYGSPIHHVGIAIGNGEMIEASETGTPVRVRTMYRRDYAGAGRVN